ncbi:MAG: hypothetical protein DI619_01125 [Francisella sp.]|nr:MAG: hypothetical protein DI619_01125 [Francisella sp.]
MAGNPNLNTSLVLMDQLVCAGADILKVGFPRFLNQCLFT